MCSEIFLDCSPEELYEIQFTVELWKENAQVPSSLDHLLDKRLLLLEIGLKIKDTLCTTVSNPSFTFIHPLPSYTASQVHFSICLAREELVSSLSVGQRIHSDQQESSSAERFSHHSLYCKPPISKWGLFSTRFQIHVWCEECILWICQMTLWVVNHNECLVFGSMCFLKSQNDSFLKLYVD